MWEWRIHGIWVSAEYLLVHLFPHGDTHCCGSIIFLPLLFNSLPKPTTWDRSNFISTTTQSKYRESRQKKL